jgi:hypothetical protein
VNFAAARRMGLAIDGPKALTRAFPGWFDLYPFAHVGPAGRQTHKSPAHKTPAPAPTAMGAS